MCHPGQIIAVIMITPCIMVMMIAKIKSDPRSMINDPFPSIL